MTRHDSFIPALRWHWLTPLYDPLLRWAMREEQFKRRLISQAAIQPQHKVLDLGCGTGTLTVLIKQMQPKAEVVGLDGDRPVLDLARAKAAEAGITITWQQGMAFDLPYSDDTFDRVLSSLVLHHLITENKQRTLDEVWRVLRPGGELHVIDFGPPHGVYGQAVSIVVRRLERTMDNIEGRLPLMFRNAGFKPVQETGQITTVFGNLSLYQGGKLVQE